MNKPKDATEHSGSTVCYASSIEGKRFRVTIDRSEMERRYQLAVVDDDEVVLEIGPPLRWKQFEETHGFEAEWPHEIVGPVPEGVQVRYA